MTQSLIGRPSHAFPRRKSCTYLPRLVPNSRFLYDGKNKSDKFILICPSHANWAFETLLPGLLQHLIKQAADTSAHHSEWAFQRNHQMRKTLSRQNCRLLRTQKPAVHPPRPIQPLASSRPPSTSTVSPAGRATSTPSASTRTSRCTTAPGRAASPAPRRRSSTPVLASRSRPWQPWNGTPSAASTSTCRRSIRRRRATEGARKWKPPDALIASTSRLGRGTCGSSLSGGTRTAML